MTSDEVSVTSSGESDRSIRIGVEAEGESGESDRSIRIGVEAEGEGVEDEELEEIGEVELEHEVEGPS